MLLPLVPPGILQLPICIILQAGPGQHYHQLREDSSAASGAVASKLSSQPSLVLSNSNAGQHQLPARTCSHSLQVGSPSRMCRVCCPLQAGLAWALGDLTINP